MAHNYLLQTPRRILSCNAGRIFGPVPAGGTGARRHLSRLGSRNGGAKSRPVRISTIDLAEALDSSKLFKVHSFYESSEDVMANMLTVWPMQPQQSHVLVLKTPTEGDEVASSAPIHDRRLGARPATAP